MLFSARKELCDVIERVSWRQAGPGRVVMRLRHAAKPGELFWFAEGFHNRAPPTSWSGDIWSFCPPLLLVVAWPLLVIDRTYDWARYRLAYWTRQPAPLPQSGMDLRAWELTSVAREGRSVEWADLRPVLARFSIPVELRNARGEIVARGDLASLFDAFPSRREHEVQGAEYPHERIV
jgi:hypothetical protein